MTKKPVAEPRLLILGASGFIGSRLLTSWHPRPCVATFRSRPLQPRGVYFDIAGDRLADRLLRRGHGFTHAILTHGITKLDQCAQLRDPSKAVNVIGTLRAVTDLLDAGVHTIFLSSDAVFDGHPGLRTEEDEPHPILAYGRDKLAVERELVAAPGGWTILRLTKVIAGFADDRNLLSQWLTQIKLGNIIRCAIDQTLTPVDIDYVIRAIEFIVATTTPGIFHISGSEMVTRYELFKRLLRHTPAAVRDSADLLPCKLAEIPSSEPLPLNCALSNLKFAAVSGITPRSLDRICEELCDLQFGGYVGTSLAADYQRPRRDPPPLTVK
jgi:dTDP-4-dehydrorhamnose reductase